MHLLSGEGAETEDRWRYGDNAEPDIGDVKFDHVDVVFRRCCKRKFDTRTENFNFSILCCGMFILK